VRLRTLAVREEVSKTKRRGRQVICGSIESSGTARVIEPVGFKSIFIYKKALDKSLGYIPVVFKGHCKKRKCKRIENRSYSSIDNPYTNFEEDSLLNFFLCMPIITTAIAKQRIIRINIIIHFLL